MGRRPWATRGPNHQQGAGHARAKPGRPDPTDARRLAAKAIGDNGIICESDLPEVMRAKYELLGRDSPLSFEYETAQFAEIGGMRRLRQWLEVRQSFFRD